MNPGGGLSRFQAAESGIKQQFAEQREKIYTQIGNQEGKAKEKVAVQVKESISSQLKTIDQKQDYLRNVIANLTAKKDQIPGGPEGMRARQQIEEHIGQLRASIAHLEQARKNLLSLQEMQTKKVQKQVAKQFADQKKGIDAQLKAQEGQAIEKIHSQQDQLMRMAGAQRGPEGKSSAKG
jgi:hypothetical protein